MAAPAKPAHLLALIPADMPGYKDAVVYNGSKAEWLAGPVAPSEP